LPAYRLPSPYARPPLRRRLSGFALALGINLMLLMVLMTLGIIPPPAQKTLRGTVIDLLPQSKSVSPAPSHERRVQRPRVETDRPLPKPPPIVLPVKPTIAPPPQPSTKPTPWLEMSSDEMAASDIGKLPAAGSGSAGDSEVVGRGPNGEALYAAQWAREPTDAELAGYLPRNRPRATGSSLARPLKVTAWRTASSSPTSRQDRASQARCDKPPGSSEFARRARADAR
jgi:periplasmic protein TonB